jgi:hypothetical protein
MLEHAQFQFNRISTELASLENRKEDQMRSPHFKANCQTGKHGKSVMPVWDKKCRELRLGDVVVKRFRWPASNQERILQAFQEEGWPPKIIDPLPPHPSICPKRRLHDAIKCLNRRQIDGLLRFRGDGTGQGVVVEIRAQQAIKSKPQKQLQ